MSIVLTLSVFGTWATLALGLSAIGVFFLNRLGGIEPTWYHLYYGIWTGFALLIASLMLWHFVLPVNERALFTFASSAALALLVERRWFASVLRLPSFNRPFAVVVTMFTLWTANHALAKGFAYDDYLYEFQAIRWFYDYPLVPGLANLHGRMAFNNSHHLFAALLSSGPWRGAVNVVFNGFFVALAGGFLLGAVWDLAQGTQGSFERSLFPALLICPCVALVQFGMIGPMLATLKADVFVTAASLVLTCLFVRFAATPPGTADSAALAATTLVLGAVIPSVKISALVFCGFIVAVVALKSLLQLRLGRPCKGMILGALAVAAVLGISFPVRGIVLSGYPFYPSTAFRVNVDWRAPLAQAEADRAFITSFAHLGSFTYDPNDVRITYDPQRVSGWLWVPEWARFTAITDRIGLLLPLVLTLASVPLLVVPQRKEPRVSLDEAPPAWAYATLACASVASLIVWFIQAPAGRFAIAQAWTLFASVFVYGVQKQRGGWTWTAALVGLGLTLPLAALVLLSYLRISGEQRLLVLVLLTFVAIWMVLFGVLRTVNPRLIAVLVLFPALYQYGERSAAYFLSHDYANLMKMLWVNVSQLPHRAPPATVSRQTRSGLQIYETARSTFETALPNTPYFNPFLELRTTSLRDGFRNVAPLQSAHYGEESPLSMGYEPVAQDYR